MLATNHRAQRSSSIRGSLGLASFCTHPIPISEDQSVRPEKLITENVIRKTTARWNQERLKGSINVATLISGPGDDAKENAGRR